MDNADFPGGVCTSRCGSSGTCPSGSTCLQLSTGEYCARSCESGDGCPTGLVCGSGGSAGKVCLTPASAPAMAVSCSTAPVIVNGGVVAAAETAGCVQPIVASTYPATLGTTLALGSHPVGTKVQFQLPAGTTGFTVVSQGSSSNVSKVSAFGSLLPNGPVPTPIQEPNGTFFDYPASFAVPPSDRNLTWSPISPVTGAVTFPNGTSGLQKAAKGLTPGTWSLTVSDLLQECKALQCGDPASGSTANSYDLTVLTRSGGIPERGALDLDIYLVSAGLSAATAPGDPDLRRMLQRVTADFAQAGICLQTVTYYDVPAWARSRWALVNAGPAPAAEPCSEYRQLFTLARPGNAVALFFVDQIAEANAPSGTRLVGYDGAIPGVSTFNGTIAGGAIVSTGDLRKKDACGSTFNTSCGPDVVGETVAHEVGHALGLFHPTESQGGASGEDFDPLTDTPQCLCSLCVSASARANCADQSNVQGQATEVDGASCAQGTQACGGADYLMFWQLTNLSRGNLSPQEGQVMRLNPLVRPL